MPTYIWGYMVVYFEPCITHVPPGEWPWGGIGLYEGYLKGLVPHSTNPPKINDLWYHQIKQAVLWHLVW